MFYMLLSIPHTIIYMGVQTKSDDRETNFAKAGDYDHFLKMLTHEN